MTGRLSVTLGDMITKQEIHATQPCLGRTTAGYRPEKVELLVASMGYDWPEEVEAQDIADAERLGDNRLWLLAHLLANRNLEMACRLRVRWLRRAAKHAESARSHNWAELMRREAAAALTALARAGNMTPEDRLQWSLTSREEEGDNLFDAANDVEAAVYEVERNDSEKAVTAGLLLELVVAVEIAPEMGAQS